MNSTAERWTELVGWLDYWFQPEKGEGWHDFDAAEQELFDALAPAWLAVGPGVPKVEVLESFAGRFGRERVHALLDKLCADESRAYWGDLAAKEGQSLDDLVRLLWGELASLGFDYTSEREGNRLEFCVTRCPYSELAKELGIEEWFRATVCAGDPYTAEAFSEVARFERTKTLMEGHDCCDHTYFVAEDSPAAS